MQIGGNMFSVEPQHQFLKTYEATQKWLHHNLGSEITGVPSTTVQILTQ
jgi:hypothetical protein